MDSLISFYRFLSNTKALEKVSDCHEYLFFEHFHRITYLSGLSTADRNIPYMVFSFLVKLMIYTSFVSEAWDLVFNSDSLDSIIDSINVTILPFMAIYKFKHMNKNEHIFKKLARATESQNFDTSTPDRQKILDMWSRRTIHYILLVTGLGFCTLTSWNIYPLFDDLEYNLAVATYVPFEYKTKARYPIVYILVQVGVVTTGGLIMVVDIVMLSYLMHLLCQYAVLANCFENILDDCRVGFEGIDMNTLITDEGFRNKYKARLGDLVAQHILILNNTLELKKIFSTPMLCQLGASLILISSIGYQVTSSVDKITKLLMSCLFLGYNMFELFIICRWCDDIKYQSENVGDAVYFSGWECGLTTLPGVRHQLSFIILRANKPVVLTAGGMYDLSLVSFSNLVKTSYSALTFLLQAR